MQRIDRRAFLGLGLGAAAFVACGGGDGETGADPSPMATPVDPETALSVALTAPQLVVGDTRMAFALIRGGSPIAPDGVTVSLIPPGGSTPDPITPDKQTIRLGLGGEEQVEGHEHEAGTEVQELFVFRHPFEVAGFWGVEVEVDGVTGSANFQVIEESPAPGVGDPAKAVDSPTFDEPLGVDPVCTRDPDCTMHDMTIAQALEAGKPLVVTFATPKYCTSRTCGPVVDILEQIKGDMGEEVDFIHVEVWRDADSVNQPEGTVRAFAEWGLLTEPFTFFVNADGTIADRWIGAMGFEETQTAVRQLAAGELGA